MWQDLGQLVTYTGMDTCRLGVGLGEQIFSFILGDHSRLALGLGYQSQVWLLLLSPSIAIVVGSTGHHALWSANGCWGLLILVWSSDAFTRTVFPSFSASVTTSIVVTACVFFFSLFYVSFLSSVIAGFWLHPVDVLMFKPVSCQARACAVARCVGVRRQTFCLYMLGICCNLWCVCVLGLRRIMLILEIDYIFGAHDISNLRMNV